MEVLNNFSNPSINLVDIITFQHKSVVSRLVTNGIYKSNGIGHNVLQTPKCYEAVTEPLREFDEDLVLPIFGWFKCEGQFANPSSEFVSDCWRWMGFDPNNYLILHLKMNKNKLCYQDFHKFVYARVEEEEDGSDYDSFEDFPLDEILNVSDSKTIQVTFPSLNLRDVQSIYSYKEIGHYELELTRINPNDLIENPNDFINCYHFCTKDFYKELLLRRIIVADDRYLSYDLDKPIDKIDPAQLMYRYVFEKKKLNEGNGMFFHWQHYDYKNPVQFLNDSNVVLLKLRIPKSDLIETHYENWCSFIIDLYDADNDMGKLEEYAKERGSSVEKDYNSIFQPDIRDESQYLTSVIKLKWVEDFKYCDRLNL